MDEIQVILCGQEISESNEFGTHKLFCISKLSRSLWLHYNNQTSSIKWGVLVNVENFIFDIHRG